MSHTTEPHRFINRREMQIAVNIISLKHSLVHGCEEQHRHPLVVKEQKTMTQESLLDVALWGLVNGYPTNTNTKLFESIGNSILEFSPESFGKIEIPGGWEDERVVFELTAEIRMVGLMNTEIVSGFVHDNTYYPTRITTVRGDKNNKISQQVSLLYRLDGKRSSPDMHMQMPAHLGQYIELRDMQSAAGVYQNMLDTRSTVSAAPVMIDNRYLSVGSYLEGWTDKSRHYLQNGKLSVEDRLNHLPRQENALKAGIFRALMNVTGMQVGTFTQADLACLDRTFVQAEIEPMSLPLTNQLDKFRLCHLEDSPVSSRLIRRVLSILESEPVSVKEESFNVVFVVKGHGENDFLLPENMYDLPHQYHAVHSKLQVFEAELNNILYLSVDFRLNGMTTVIVKYRRDMGSADYFKIPTYAGGIISPLIVPEREDMAPLADLLSRMLIE